MHSSAFGVSETGPTREGNEDAFLVDHELGLFVVCDGMGGHASGELASRLAVKTAGQYLRSRLQTTNGETVSIMHAAQQVLAAFHEANNRLLGFGATSPQHRGLGTTMTLLLVVGNDAVVGHVGDSRLYHIRSSKARRVTTDHTLANDLIDSGYCQESELKNSRANHTLTRALGHEDDLEVDVFTFPLAVGDFLLLSTDGLHNCVQTSDELAVYVYGQPEQISRRLVQLANEDDGSDNVTVLTVRVADHLPNATPPLPVRDASDSTIISGS